MPAWVRQSAWRRYSAITFVSVVLAQSVGALVAESANVQIVTGWWTGVVFAQVALQLFVALISDIAAGNEDNDQAATLAIFGISLSALVAVVELPLLSTFGSGVGPEQTESSLLGSILCASDPTGCASSFERLSLITAIVLAFTCSCSAFLLRLRFKEKSKANTGVLNMLLAILASTGFAFWFLLIQSWDGVIVPTPDRIQIPPIPSGTSTLSRAEFNEFVLVYAIVSVFGFGTLQAFAMLLARLPGRRGGAVLLSHAERSVAAIKNALRFVTWLLVEILVIALAVAIPLGLIVSLVIGLATLADSLLAIAVLLFHGTEQLIEAGSAATRTAVRSSVEVAPAIVRAGGFTVLTVIGLATVIAFSWAVWRVVRDGLVIGMRQVVHLAHAIWAGVVWLLQSAFELGRNYLEVVVVLLSAYSIWLVISLLPLSSEQERRPPEQTQVDSKTRWAPPLRLPPQFPDEQIFSEVELNCQSGLLRQDLAWAFGSNQRLSFDVSDCGLSRRLKPATIFVIGTASRDDSTQGGYELSMQRAIRLSGQLQEGSPDAEIIAVALGRVSERAVPFRMRDLYHRDRRIWVFASEERLPLLFHRPPLSETAEQLLRVRGILGSYDFCELIAPDDISSWDSRTKSSSPFSCEWARLE